LEFAESIMNKVATTAALLMLRFSLNDGPHVDRHQLVSRAVAASPMAVHYALGEGIGFTKARLTPAPPRQLPFPGEYLSLRHKLLLFLGFVSEHIASLSFCFCPA
jgi:hypothetical protein